VLYGKAFWGPNFQKLNDINDPVLVSIQMSYEEWVTFADDGHHVLLEIIKTPILASLSAHWKRTDSSILLISSELSDLKYSINNIPFCDNIGFSELQKMFL